MSSPPDSTLTPWTALREARLTAVLTQPDVAAYIHSTQAIVSNYETGRLLPSKSTYRLLRQMFPDLAPPTVDYDDTDSTGEAAA